MFSPTTDPFTPYTDWRISTTGDLGPTIWNTYLASLILCSITAIAYIFILYRLLWVQGRPIFRFENGIFKPMPLEGFLVTTFLFIVGRVIFSAMMVARVDQMEFKHKGYVLEAFHEWPWGFGCGGISIYLVGIVFATPTTVNDEARKKVHLPSGIQMNAFSIFMIILPFILANVLAGVTGYYTDIGDMDKAIKVTRAHYWIWAIWTSILMIAFVFFGHQLDRLLSANVSWVSNQQNTTNSRIARLEAARKKLRYITLLLAAIFFSYAFALIVYATAQRQILTFHPAFSVFFLLLWVHCGPALMFIVSLFIIWGNSQKEGATSKTDSGRKQSQSASSAAARGTEGTKVGIMSKEEGTVRSATVKSRSGADGDV